LQSISALPAEHECYLAIMLAVVYVADGSCQSHRAVQLIQSFVHEDEWMDATAAVHVFDAQVHAVTPPARSLLT